MAQGRAQRQPMSGLSGGQGKLNKFTNFLDG
jgi:hypothetical protein